MFAPFSGVENMMIALTPTTCVRQRSLVTLGPATESVESIKSRLRTGAKLFRLNMSHASHEWVRDVYGRIRHAAVELDTDVAVLMDLTGPSIRTGDLATPWQLKVGDRVEFRTEEAVPATMDLSTTVNYPGITGDLKPGDPIAIDGGLIQMRTIASNGKRIIAEVVTGGEMKSRRHINLPGVDVNLPPLTKKDYLDLDLGVELKRGLFCAELRARTGTHPASGIAAGTEVVPGACHCQDRKPAGA